MQIAGKCIQNLIVNMMLIFIKKNTNMEKHLSILTDDSTMQEGSPFILLLEISQTVAPPC
jgi:hypothetical protein